MSSKIRLDAMSKVISFSISDRYLDKLRTLYPALTDNLAAKQFLTDRLDGSLGNSLDDSLDAKLDGKLKSLIESELDGILDERLNAVVGKLITSLSERLTRLEERLDDSLDGRLDDMELLLRMQREASIASPIPTIEKTSPLPPSPDEQGTDAIETLTSESDSSIEGEDAIETLTPEVSPSPQDQPAIGTLPTVETGMDTVESGSDTEPVKEAIEADDREWLTLQQIADKKIKGLPGTHQGLRPYAENWEWRENPTKKGKQYKIPKEYL